MKMKESCQAYSVLLARFWVHSTFVFMVIIHAVCFLSFGESHAVLARDKTNVCEYINHIQEKSYVSRSKNNVIYYK
jgi:hypothetical protein